ncbi:MAG: hypothetical protein ACREBW_03195 [Candidatus Micrarchaeaceae archaeon]
MSVTTVVMCDAMGVNAHNIPAGMQKVGAYLTGSGGVAWSVTDLARFHVPELVTINQLPADPGNITADVDDMETNAATIKDAVDWSTDRVKAGKMPSIYVQASRVAELINALKASGINAADLWMANWNLSESEARAQVKAASGPFPVKAIQFASPSSNPNTFIPGTNRTLAEADVDLSIANADWPAVKITGVPPVKKTGIVIESGLSVHRVMSADDGKTWVV